MQVRQEVEGEFVMPREAKNYFVTGNEFFDLHRNPTKERDVEVQKEKAEAVNHPAHYNTYKGVEIIDLVEQMPFNTGNAVKYITRAPFKGKEIEDLKKAIWYINREIERLEK